MDPLLEKIYGMDEKECDACAEHLMLGGGTRGGPLLVKGKGVRLYDPDGKDYIDCTSQSWAAYLGFANEEIKRVVAEQMDKLFRAHHARAVTFYAIYPHGFRQTQPVRVLTHVVHKNSISGTHPAFLPSLLLTHASSRTAHSARSASRPAPARA